MPLFLVNRTSTALSTSNDLVTVVASATKPLRILMAKIGGMGTASAANEVLMQRSTVGTTGGGGITPTKVNTGSAAASFSAYTTWSVQPTLTANEVLHRFTVNANGGIDPFVALPGGEISIPVSGQVSFRSASGTSNAIINLLIEEVDG
jgi:hypothetical protein